MPLVVDHEERRDQIADVVKTIVAESGMKAVTIRNVAREAGFSSTIVSHYFRDKRELLMYAYSSVQKIAEERVHEIFNSGGSLMDCINVVLPNDKVNLRDWQAWFGFWGRVTADPELSAVRLDGIERTQALFRWLLENAKQRGELPAEVDVAFHATRLQMMLNGLASFVIMKPDAWSPDRQRDVILWQIELMKTMPRGDLPAAKPQPRTRAKARGAA